MTLQLTVSQQMLERKVLPLMVMLPQVKTMLLLPLKRLQQFHG